MTVAVKPTGAPLPVSRRRAPIALYLLADEEERRAHAGALAARRAWRASPGCGPSSKVSATTPASVERSRTASARRSAGDHAHSAGPACTVAAASAPAVSAALSWRRVMASIVLGVVAACTASVMYNLGVALQALEARVMPAAQGLRPSLIGDLAHRPRWLAGTALGVVGWPLQAAALLLAPLTVVQPALAFGLVLLLVLGARTLHEPVWRARRAGRRRDHRRRRRPGGRRTAHVLASRRRLAAGPRPAGLAAVALAPYALRGRNGVGGIAAALSAGAAFAWGGLSTKFVADALSAHQWLPALAWTVATGLSSGLAVLSEMSALQRRPATQVAPLVFVVQVVIPGARRATARGGELGARPARGRRDHRRPGGGHRRRGGTDGRARRARARRRGAQQRRERDHAQPADPQRRGSAATVRATEPSLATTTIGSRADGAIGGEPDTAKLMRPTTGEA